jgi:hypothetical protein
MHVAYRMLSNAGGFLLIYSVKIGVKNSLAGESGGHEYIVGVETCLDLRFPFSPASNPIFTPRLVYCSYESYPVSVKSSPIGYKMPPLPPPSPPAGFAWLAKLPTPEAWTYLNKGTGGVYQVANAVGTDDASPCIALYVRFNQNGMYCFE